MDNVVYMNGPNKDCVSWDSKGRSMYLFSVSWRYRKKSFSTLFWARNERHARKHVKAMRKSMKLDGQIMSMEDAEDSVEIEGV